FKQVLKKIKEYNANGVEVDVLPIGSKAQAFFRRFGGNVIASKTNLGDHPTYAQLRGVINKIIGAYEEGHIDRILLARNEFVNSMTQKPEVMQLVPLVVQQDERLNHRWDYIYEPESAEVLDATLRRYLAGVIVQATIENVACEMAARRIAMKNATDNAGDMIRDLKLVYNKARQAAITQEISEIVSGAAAV
ncbi:MAG: ATP synthase F1 subunit gamma, partial [Halothiobacillaceae bacterium]